MFFFFKQKTEYELRISYWSSDVCSSDLLLDHVKGPDFPTGGIVVDSPETIAHAYETGRGGFRVRARFSTGKLGDGGWEADGIEKLSGGTWQHVISEIPQGVAKGKLIEQNAQLNAEQNRKGGG